MNHLRLDSSLYSCAKQTARHCLDAYTLPSLSMRYVSNNLYWKVQSHMLAFIHSTEVVNEGEANVHN